MKKRLAVLAAAFCTIALVAGVAAAGVDFGQFVQRQLADQSSNLFGVSGPLPASSTKSPRAPRPPSSPAPTRVTRFAPLHGARSCSLRRPAAAPTGGACTS